MKILNKIFKVFTFKKKVTKLVKEESRWELSGKTYSPPKPTSNPDFPVPVLEKAVLGVTTFMFSNQYGEMKTVEVLGTDETEMNDILDSALLKGVQYINYKNNKFAIALVPKEEDNIQVR